MEEKLNNLSITELEIPDFLKTYLMRNRIAFTVGDIANKARAELLER